MTAIRQDAWNHDEDLLLAETVLRHIREGSTQLSAFEEVGKKLSRTGAACGFRWNSLVRKQYESAIALAKKQRKQLKSKNKKLQVDQVVELQEKEVVPEKSFILTNEKKDSSEPMSLSKIIRYLNQMNEREATYLSLEKENSNLKKQLSLAEERAEQVASKYEVLKQDYHLIQEDYKAMMSIMERARKMVNYEEAAQTSDK